MEIVEALQIISPIAAVLSAIAAWWGILHTTRDSRARSQPYMVIELGFAPHSHETLQLIVRNVGVTPARDVVLHFHPPLPTFEWGSHGWMVAHRYDKSLPTVAPDQEFRNSWWINDMRISDPASRLDSNYYGLPGQTTVTVQYQGLGKKSFEDVYQLDVESLQLESLPVSSASTLGRLERIAGQLKLTNDHLSVIAESSNRT